MHHREPLPVGAKCRVRGWDDLVAEFGPAEDGDLVSCDAIFTEGMKHLCGQPFTVSGSRKTWDGYMIYESEEGIEGRRYISGDMLELIDEQDGGMQIPGDYSALFGMQ